MNYGILCAAFMSLSMFTSCGQRPDESESSLSYKVSTPAKAGLTRKVHKETILICMGTDSASQQHRSDVEYAVEVWTQAIDEISDKPINSNVAFTTSTDPNCDASVIIANIDRANTTMGNRPTVRLAYGGWNGSRSVTLHEFGHAFGLLDTYANSGGSCQPNQPNSVMCRASYHTLTSDDVAGIRKVYQNISQRGLDDTAETDDSEELTVY